VDEHFFYEQNFYNETRSKEDISALIYGLKKEDVL